MGPIAIFSKGGRERPTGGRDSVMGNYRIPKRKSTTAEEERKRQRLRDTRNLATGIEIALKNLLPNESHVVKKAVWNTHDSLAVDIELGVDSSRADFLGARIVDRSTPTGSARRNTGAYYGRINSGGSFQGVPSAPRAMTKYWSVLEQGNGPDHPYQQDRRGLNGPIGVPRSDFPAVATDSNNGELSSDTSGRTTHPYLQDPSDPNRLIGVPRPSLPPWATRPNYGKSGFEKPARTSYPYLQDPSDPDKFVGVPRPFDWKDQTTKTDTYNGPAFYEHRRRQIELGIVPSCYPDNWISGETFGDDDKDISSAKRLYEKEQGEIRDSGVALLNGVDRDGDVSMAQSLENPKPTPPSVSPTPVGSACGSLIQVLNGFRIEEEVVLETAEAVKASQNFFAEVELEAAPVDAAIPPAASEGHSDNDAISSLVDLGDPKASRTASTSMPSRIGVASNTNPLLSSSIEKMQPYRTSSVVGSAYSPTVLSGTSGFDGSLHKSHLGTPSHRPFGGYGTSNYSAASKAPSTVFSYAGSSASRNCPFDTMFDSVLESAIDIPVLEPTPASKSSLFAGHASNLRAPMSHNEKVSQWAASIMPNASPNSRLASPNKFGSGNRVPVEFIFPRNGLSGAKNAIPTSKLNNLLSNDLFEITGGGGPDKHAPRAAGSSKGQ